MTAGNDAGRAVLALTNRLVDVGAPPLRASEVWRLLDQVGDPSGLVGRTATELAGDLQVEAAEAERLAALLDSGMSLAVRLEALQERGIWVITPFDPAYPTRLRERLGSAAPAVLYGAGERSLLASPGIGVVGSVDVGHAGAEVAERVDEPLLLVPPDPSMVDSGPAGEAGGGEAWPAGEPSPRVSPEVGRAGPGAGADLFGSVARAAVDRALPVVAGGTVGFDQLVMGAAGEGGATTVGVLAGGLERAIGRADTRRALLAGRACLCTPYPPDAAASPGNAIGRNRILYALSRITLVVATDEGDETWAGASEALARGYGSVAVWTGAGGGPGNRALARAGAIGIDDVSELFTVEPVNLAPAIEQLPSAPFGSAR